MMYRQLYSTNLYTFFSVVFFLSFFTQLNSQEFTCTVIRHDEGRGFGLAEVILHPELDFETRVTLKIYSGENNVPSNLVVEHNSLVVSAGGRARIQRSQLSAGRYLVTGHFENTNLTCFFEVYRSGCTDPAALNYLPEATIDDGSCMFPENHCPEISTVVSEPPTCGQTNGSVLVYANGTNKQFRINQGGWQSSSYFNNLGEGAFIVSVRNSATGCVDSRAVSLTCGEDNSCPTIQSVQIGRHPSTCNSADGWFTIHATGGNNEYSADDGLTWQGGATFSDMPADRYSLKVRNVDLGCEVSITTTLSCSPSCSDGRRNGGETGVDCGGPCVPCCPEITQVRVNEYPYCEGGNTGSFTILARGKSLEYSINGGTSYQSNPTFENRASSSYNVKVRSTVTRCVESSTFTLICVDQCPEIQGVTVSESNCDVTGSGLISIFLAEGQGNFGETKPGDGSGANDNYEYSVDGGRTWSINNTFSVDAGEYSVLVRNNETDCTRGQSGIIVECHSCFDGILNGNEIEIDCGGDCHTCNCPSIEDIKASEAALLGTGGPRGGSGGDLSGGNGNGEVFICDLPENFDCPDCISYRSCHDDLDNDGDDLCDCSDPECATWFDEICEKPKEDCEDGLDNDQDGLVDCADPACRLKCSALTFEDDFRPLSNFMLDLHEEHDLLRQFIASQGLPLYDKGLILYPNQNRGVGTTSIVCPVLKLGHRTISGFIYGTMRNGKTTFADYISKSQIETALSNSEGEIRYMNTQAAIDLYLTMQAKVDAFVEVSFDMKSLSNAPVVDDLGRDVPENCIVFRICFDYCDDLMALNGEDEPRDPVIGSSSEDCPEWALVRYYVTLIICSGDPDGNQVGEGFSDDTNNPTDGSSGIRTSDDTINPSGGSSSSTNTGSVAFNDRIKNCESSGVGPPRDGGEASADDAFCGAITRIISTCVGSAGTGLAEPSKRHLLEILSSVPDCDNSGALDDEGSLSEVGDFMCANGANDENIATVSEYVDYAASVGVEEAVCFEDYVYVKNFLDGLNIRLDLADLLTNFDIDRCLELFGCSHPVCPALDACLENKIIEEIKIRLDLEGDLIFTEDGGVKFVPVVKDWNELSEQERVEHFVRNLIQINRIEQCLSSDRLHGLAKNYEFKELFSNMTGTTDIWVGEGTYQGIDVKVVLNLISDTGFNANGVQTWDCNSLNCTDKVISWSKRNANNVNLSTLEFRVDMSDFENFSKLFFKPCSD